ncbi:TIGR03086 family metal-binding protein [Nocardia sp. NPDC052316]|uniref:TIGR03086 family metal-binding protein n=1 Tax=Nocardia sp. NPDC052316 TaxID=3364329 RepID=UPI0037CC2889
MTAAIEDLGRAFAAVADLLAEVRPEQWAAPTPCSEWNVRDVVEHLVTVNLSFTAQLENGPLPQRGADLLGDNPIGAYRGSAASLLNALDRTGVRERTESGPLAEQLQLRLADLITHGWDLTQATGIPVALPDEFAERSLTFIQQQLALRPRGTQFAEAQPVDDTASALDRLAAFAGRTIG